MGQPRPEFPEVQPGYFFVEVTRQDVNADRVALSVVEQFYLGEDLVGEAGGHDKARVPGGASQVYQSPLCENDHRMAVGELPYVHLRFHLVARNAWVAS